MRPSAGFERGEVMARYLVCIHHPDGYDPSAEDAAMRRDIDALNEAMVAAGVRMFVGGLQVPSLAQSLVPAGDGTVRISDGPYLQANAHVGGFWVLETDGLAAAVDWGRRAALACRAPVEVRPFH
jgi:hypothetical protein